MRQIEEMTEWVGVERKRVEAVVETLANLRGNGESLAEVAHDARNMVTALGLYCDLLEEPGVLAPTYRHYGNELRLVATASRRLVEKLVSLDSRSDRRQAASDPATGPTEIGAPRLFVQPRPVNPPQSSEYRGLLPAEPIQSLASELLASRNLLAALAGPAIAVTLDAEGGSRPVKLTAEDLTRVLVNLVKNAAEAMTAGGRIHLGLREHPAVSGTAERLSLTIEDNGPGIPEEALEAIFESGYTTRTQSAAGAWPASHHGLGLAITRSIVEEAGGRIHAVNRSPSGARFEIELPVRTR